MRFLTLVLAAVCGTALAAAPPAVRDRPVGQVVAWDSAKDGEYADYRIGPYRLGLRPLRVPVGDDPGAFDLAPQMRIGADDIAQLSVTGVAAWPSHAMASFLVARLDPRSQTPSIVMTSFSGGAHCCMQVQIATPARHGWLVANMGSFDNEPLYEPPRDLDGDGAVDLVVRDDRFAYKFDSYAGSYQPIRIFGVRDGAVVELSSEPRFRPVIEADMRKAGALCRDHQSGACAAYVADAARLGRFNQAWSEMLKAVTPSFQHPSSICEAPACPPGRERSLRDYPTALKWFLGKTGYPVPAGQGGAAA